MPHAHADRVSRMLRDIDMEYSLTRGYTGRNRMPTRIRESLAQVPRHEFVPPDLRAAAYENHPLPIGQGQTISQPFIVALMTDLLNPADDHRILEVGCGCGYQAAVLSMLAKEVYSAEIITTLAVAARDRLRRLGYGNITVEAMDGYYGWPEHAPYDGIIVTAASVSVPQPLVRQLRPGGRLVLPVGPPAGFQQLVTVTKGEGGAVHTEVILGVAFVPLTGFHGEEPER